MVEIQQILDEMLEIQESEQIVHCCEAVCDCFMRSLLPADWDSGLAEERI